MSISVSREFTRDEFLKFFFDSQESKELLNELSKMNTTPHELVEAIASLQQDPSVGDWSDVPSAELEWRREYHSKFKKIFGELRICHAFVDSPFVYVGDHRFIRGLGETVINSIETVDQMFDRFTNEIRLVPTVKRYLDERYYSL